MSDDAYRKHSLTEAIKPSRGGPDPSIPDEHTGPTHATAAEQTREAQEGQQAHNAQGDPRDRLVDIGKANHMAGRSNGRRSDS